MKLLTLLALGLLIPVGGAFSAETEGATYPGLKTLQVGTAVSGIRPGEEFTIGVFFAHEKDYHTYWKSPGVVGVPAILDWKQMPAGFTAGEFEWPAPQKTLMATINAWGYETDTCLLIPVKAPEDLKGKKKVTFKGRLGWMCCASSCHPGHHDFSLTLPVLDAGAEVSIDKKWQSRFEDSRRRFPRKAPKRWQFTAREIDANTVQLIVRQGDQPSAIDWSQAYFFADDNQVDSDAPQKVEDLPEDDLVVFTFKRPDFAPKNPPQLSGVLHLPGGWRDLDGHPWMIASAPWAGYEKRASDAKNEEEKK